MEGGSPMAGVITALSSEITVAKLMALLADIVPFVGIMVIAAFGYRLFRKLVSGANKGKAKV